MYEEFGISNKIIEVARDVEKELEPIFDEYENNCMMASAKVLKASSY